MSASKASATELERAETTATSEDAHPLRPSCAREVRSADSREDDNEGHKIQPRSSTKVKFATDNASIIASLAASRVWGPALKVKVPNQTTLKAQARCSDHVQKTTRAAMLEILHLDYQKWPKGQGGLNDIDKPEMERQIFRPGNAFIWLTTVDMKAEVKAFCMIQPETEQLEMGELEDVVRLLHIHADPEFDHYNLYPSLMGAVREYCRLSEISKISVPSSQMLTGLLTKEGFHFSQETAIEDCKPPRYELA